MEDNLNAPLSDVLEIIQKRQLSHSTSFGVPAQKSPTDFWVYQEIIYETKPDVILEIGVRKGGSVFAFAHLLDLLGKGRVIGIDISLGSVAGVVKNHPRITLMEGDACKLFERVKSLIAPGEKVLIIEDSSHTYENTLNVLRTYSVLIQSGGYFIVEDGICHHGIKMGPNPGPYEATEVFVRENSDFEIDRSKEDFLITWNPKGYLKRKSTDFEKSGTKYGKIPFMKRVGKLTADEFFRLLIPPVIYIIVEKLKSSANS